MADSSKCRVDVDLTEDDVSGGSAKMLRSGPERRSKYGTGTKSISSDTNEVKKIISPEMLYGARGLGSPDDYGFEPADAPSKYVGLGSSTRYGSKRSPQSRLNAPFASMKTAGTKELFLNDTVSDDEEDDFAPRSTTQRHQGGVVGKTESDSYQLRREEKIMLMEKERRAAAVKEREELARSTYRPREQRHRDATKIPQIDPEETAPSHSGGSRPSKFSACDSVSRHSPCETSREAASEEKSEMPGGHWKMFHCVICTQPFGSRIAVRNHFPKCEKRKGNPCGKLWNDHASCGLPSASKRERAEAYKFVPQYEDAPPTLPNTTKKPALVAPVNARIKSWPEPLRSIVHGNDIIYGCPLCEQFFQRKDNVNRHLIKQVCQKPKKGSRDGTPSDDDDDDESDPEPEDFKCPICQTCHQRSKFPDHVKECAADTSTADSPAEQSVSPKKPAPKHSTSAKQKPVDVLAKLKGNRSPSTNGQATPTSGRKRLLQDIGVDEVFTPDQIVTSRAYHTHKENKKRKVDRKSDGARKAASFMDAARDDDEEMAYAGNYASELPQGFEDDDLALPQDDGMEIDVGVGVNGDNIGVENVVANVASSNDGQTCDTLIEDVAPRAMGNITKPGDPATFLQHVTAKVTEANPKPDESAVQSTDITMSSTPKTTGTNIEPDHPAVGSEDTPKAKKDDEQTAIKPVATSTEPASIESLLTDATAHPLTGGKSVSTAGSPTNTAAAAADKVFSEPTEIPDLIYLYYIILKNWGQGLSEAKAATKQLGPFLTLAEANAVAAKEVQSPIDRFATIHAMNDARVKEEQEEGQEVEDGPGITAKKPPFGYQYVEDGEGMQTHRFNLGGTNASATVVRREAPPHLPTTTIDENATHADEQRCEDFSDTENTIVIPTSAFRSPPRIYLVHMLRRYGTPITPSSTPPSSETDDLFNEPAASEIQPLLPDAEATILSSYTLPSLATRYALRIFGDVKTRGMKPADRETTKMELRREGEEWEGEDWKMGGVFWSGKCLVKEKVEGGGKRKGECAVWVSEVVVGGPRN